MRSRARIVSAFWVIAARADSLRSLDGEIRQVWQEGRLESISGIGGALALKIDELLRTGHLAYLEKLREQVPPGVVGLLAIPDVGPAKARAMWERLGITASTPPKTRAGRQAA